MLIMDCRSYFFFKQKTAYEMRISDWSSDVCSSDLLAVLGHRLADRVQRLGHRRIDEAAGVHHHHVGVVVAGRQLVAFDPQLGEDALGIDQRLGAAEADETDLGWGRGHGLRARETAADYSGARIRVLNVDRKSTRLNSSH